MGDEVSSFLQLVHSLGNPALGGHDFFEVIPILNNDVC